MHCVCVPVPVNNLRSIYVNVFANNGKNRANDKTLHHQQIAPLHSRNIAAFPSVSWVHEVVLWLEADLLLKHVAPLYGWLNQTQPIHDSRVQK